MTNYSLILARNFSVSVIISDVKLQTWYGNVSYISVPRWRPGLKMLRMKEVKALKDAAENLNMRKSTINWVKVFESGVMKVALRKTLRRFVLSSWIKYTYSSGFLRAYVNKTKPTTIVSVIW